MVTEIFATRPRRPLDVPKFSSLIASELDIEKRSSYNEREEQATVDQTRGSFPRVS